MVMANNRRSSIRWVVATAVLAAGMVTATAGTGGTPHALAPAPKYIGSAKCKNCHATKANGDQYGRWKAEKHSHAFESLALPAALAAGKERGIAEPQKEAACLKCHSTAATEPADRLAKGFDPKEGVGCEACHGPGEAHFKARMAAAAAAEGDAGFGDEEAATAVQKLPDGEIVLRPKVDLCVKCHNKESPTYKPFCMKERVKEIAHFDPRKPRTPEQLAAKDFECLPDCEKCKAGGGK